MDKEEKKLDKKDKKAKEKKSKGGKKKKKKKKKDKKTTKWTKKKDFEGKHAISSAIKWGFISLMVISCPINGLMLYALSKKKKEKKTLSNL